MTVQRDGSILMQPVKVVPVTPGAQEERADYPVDTQQWAQAHASQIARYNVGQSARTLLAARAALA